MAGTFDAFIRGEHGHAALLEDLSIWHREAIEAQEKGSEGATLLFGFMMEDVASFATCRISMTIRAAMSRLSDEEREHCDPRVLAKALLEIADEREQRRLGQSIKTAKQAAA